MPTLTPNYSFNQPLVNNATDADLWGGQLNSNWGDLDTELKNVADTAGRLPVNFVLFTATNINPGSAVGSGGLGYGTWTQISEGRFIVGVGQGTDANTENRTYPAGDDSFGEYQNTLTSSELPSLTVNFSASLAITHHVNGQDVTPKEIVTTGTGISGPALTASTSGSGNAHENSPPGFGLYVWQRTA